MKLSPSLLVLALAAAALPAFADEPAPAPDPLSFNVGVVSEYRYRGISQSRLKPALQGGLDYAAPSGFYVGAWASTIKWIKDAGGDGQVEVDLYGGYKTEVATGLTLDVGVLQYYYPSNKLSTSANTFEIYGALSYGPVTAKYSNTNGTNLFGVPGTKYSGYFDVSANFDLGDGMTLTPHIGHQTMRHVPAGSYSDYSLTLAKDFSGLVLSGAVIGTDADKSFYASPANGKFMGKTMLVVGLKKTF
ncbi:TorF family putative porin [Pelomonas sp. Root1237]|uniref:TorF family putative porin n=1 Tax=Pelomonas sp. Root1237 TaxID=1736434 RepID=UPI0006F4F028|nr:TorF family putative porin [Pelomonas sp. Root1237]KQV96670.1 hypothetical protein ASC91_03795 [Pelomonas sp. Root1237]